jgi:Asp-tRNA(Asn)/Glu-tRNA(Gln) amidotransferase B subunit
MAHPGSLPVPNKEAVKKVVQVGLAVKADIADFTEFDRKNYFYPDIPKGYLYFAIFFSLFVEFNRSQVRTFC